MATRTGFVERITQPKRTSIGNSKNSHPNNKSQKRMTKPYRAQGKGR